MPLPWGEMECGEPGITNAMCVVATIHGRAIEVVSSINEVVNGMNGLLELEERRITRVQVTYRYSCIRGHDLLHKRIVIIMEMISQ
jgi:hypothetical protein